MLSPEKQTEILALFFSKRMKVRAIARLIGVNRKSVERVINRRSVVLGVAPFSRGSRLDSFKERITELLKEDSQTTSMVILQRLRAEGYDGGYTIIKEWVKGQRIRLAPSKEAFFKMTFAVGEAAQVDWGEFGDVFGNGTQIHCFVMVLCYSRLLYIEFTQSERFEAFVRCHENAIGYFAGLRPEQLWYDNLPTAVSERMGKLVRFNARFLAYAGHHHFTPNACNLAKGNEKGRVEDGVKYIRMNFWHNRKFRDFSDLCAQATEWRDETANLREHRTTRRIPRLVFEHEEKARLEKANPEHYETDEIFSEVIRPDFHIIYETNQYSVPWTLVGCVVTVRVDAAEFRVYYQDRFVTKHSRSYLKHQEPFTKPEHESGLKEIKPQGKNAHIHWQIETLESYGEPLKLYLKCLRHSQRSLRQEVSRLLALGTIYGEKVLAETVEALLKRGSIGIDQVELALKRGSDPGTDRIKPKPMHLQDDRLGRIPQRVDLRRYDRLIFESSKDDSPGQAREPDAQAAEKSGSQEKIKNEANESINSPRGDGNSDSI